MRLPLRIFSSIGLLALFAAVTPAAAQRVGDHFTAGFNSARTGSNHGLRDFAPPLALTETISIDEDQHSAVRLLVFEDFLLVESVSEDSIRWDLRSQQDGQLLWTQELVLPAEGSAGSFVPSFSQGTVLLGFGSEVRAVDIQTGAVLWQDQTQGKISGRHPILTGDVAFYHGSEKVVAREVATATMLWDRELGTVASTPSLNGDRIYLVDEDRILHALDLFTGADLWSRQISDQPLLPGFQVNTLATEGTVFVSVIEATPGPVTTRVIALSAKDGEPLWETEADTSAGPVGLLLVDGALFAVGGNHVTTVSPLSGDVLWTLHEQILDVVIVEPFGIGLSGPVGASTMLLYQNIGQDRIQMRDSQSGSLLWSVPVPDALSFSVAGDALYVLFSDRIEVYRPSHEIFFPLIGDGSGQSTLLALVNNSSGGASVQAQFLDREGDPLAVEVEGLGKQSEFTLEIEPRSSARLQTLGGEQLQSGWMRVRSNTEIQGSSIFQFSGNGAEEAQIPDPGRVDFEAGIAAAEPSDLLSLFVQKAGAFNTGVAIANPNSQAVTILMTLKIEGIADAVITNVEIPAFGQRARFVNEFFEGKVEGDFEGTLTLEGRIPIVATAIRTKNGFQMSSVPVAPARR